MKKHLPRQHKKGAFALSMSTIIIIVIGITILTLGLRWVYGIFQDIESQRTKIGSAMEKEIGELFGASEDPLNLLIQQQTIRQKDNFALGVSIKNVAGDNRPHNIRYTLTKTSGGEWKIPMLYKTSAFELGPGEGSTDHVDIFVSKSQPTGAYRFEAKISCPGDCDIDGYAKQFTIIVAPA